MKQTFEIGMTYNKNGKYFVAVDEETLATWEHGKFVTKRPYSQHQPCRAFPVESLCKVWDINLATLDSLSDEFFTPKNCRDSSPSDRAARRESYREPPIKTVKFIRQ